ncbi:isocitrate lyase/PEP mutase family protein [Algihabitans albus]|uniref:isocitrate lyase/PEP mutase family protein n=1 Tax=Algihabitans albus TaxID=2164067 RepID=UPI000E5CA626|nr:oxaloacetate decarboxylase [Algihabitans albus]
MRKTTLLKSLIARPEILVMPGAYDPISARLVEAAGFEAIQCTGLGITAATLGLPDFSVLGMSDMAARTAHIVRATGLPVMADGDNGFGNAVNTFLAVQEFEAGGAAGINLEDQQMPKRCGHLSGKQIISAAEMVQKIRAATEARSDRDFVINARTDSLAIGGIAEVIRRGNAYMEAGATMVFVDGADSAETIARLVDEIRGPLAVNMVEGGKTPRGLTVERLQALGVARVSLPLTAILAAVEGMKRALSKLRTSGDPASYDADLAGFDELHSLMGMDRVREMEQRYATGAEKSSATGL